MKWSAQSSFWNNTSKVSPPSPSAKSTSTSNPDLHHAAIAPKLSLGFASDDHKKSARCPPVGFTPWVYNSWLAVSRLPLWKNWVRQLGLWNSQLIWKVIKKMFQTTNQIGFFWHLCKSTNPAATETNQNPGQPELKFTYTSHSSQQNHTFQQESGTKIIRNQTSSKIIQLIVQCFLLFAQKQTSFTGFLCNQKKQNGPNRIQSSPWHNFLVN